MPKISSEANALQRIKAISKAGTRLPSNAWAITPKSPAISASRMEITSASPSL